MSITKEPHDTGQTLSRLSASVPSSVKWDTNGPSPPGCCEKQVKRQVNTLSTLQILLVQAGCESQRLGIQKPGAGSDPHVVNGAKT